MSRFALRFDYNAPAVLTFSLVALTVHLLSSTIVSDLNTRWFAVGSSMSWSSPADYWRLFAHVLGHQSFDHLFVNVTMILLLGPILEERYGSPQMAFMILVTGLATGVVNVLFFSHGLMGASGIVFMFIILASIVDVRRGFIPLTFVLVAGIFLGRELVNTLRHDGISQVAHIVGGLAGGAFGFFLVRPKGS